MARLRSTLLAAAYTLAPVVGILLAADVGRRWS